MTRFWIGRAMISNTPHKQVPQAAAPDNQALLVLGVHRSGTSALLGVTKILGAAAANEQAHPGMQPAAGIIDSGRIACLDDSLLAQGEQTWANWQPLSPIQGGPDLSAQAQSILHDRFGQADVVVLNDPRLCRLVPFWTRMIQKSNRQPFYMLTTRNPLEVAQSLQASNNFRLSHGLLIWMTYVLEAEASTRGKPRTFTDFDLLLNAPSAVVGKGYKLLKRPLPADIDAQVEKISSFLTHDLHHQRVDGVDDLPPLIRGVYQVIDSWARDGEDPADYPRLDRALQLYRHFAVLSQDTDVILAALHMLDEDTPLDQRIADADALEKPQIVEKYKALLRANAALDAALQTAYSELPGQIRKRDKELGVLGRLFADLRETNEALQAQSDRNEARIAKLAVEAEAQHATRADLEAKVRAGDKRAGKLEAQVSEAQGKQKWLEGEADELHALVAKVENERARLQDENTALHTQLAEVEAERHALMTSSSWRLTGPLRAAKRLFTPSK